MGICEIHEATKDTTKSFTNANKFICELSPNILYQYVLIILWFFMVFSIAVAIAGLVLNVVGKIYIGTFYNGHHLDHKILFAL